MCLQVCVAQMTNQTFPATATRQSTNPEADNTRRRLVEGELRNRREPINQSSYRNHARKGAIFGKYAPTEQSQHKTSQL